MLDLYMFLALMMGFSGLSVFCSMRSHLLLTLLSLEFLVLVIYFVLFMFFCYYEACYYFILVFLTFSVCEGVLGLGILVGLIRNHGGDMVSSLSVLGW